MMPSKEEGYSTTTLSAAYQRLTSKIYANCKDNSHGEHGKIGQLDNWTIGQMPFSELWQGRKEGPLFRC